MACAASHNRKRRKAKKENPYPDLQLDRSYLVEAPIEVLSNVSHNITLNRQSDWST